MGKAKRMPQHDGRRGESYVHKTAREFADRFPWADLTSLEICSALNACYHSHMASISRVFDDLGFGKTLGRSTLLRALSFAGRPLTHNEIALALEVTPGSVTYLVDALEREDFVRRTIDETDRRTVHVELTAKGENAGAKMAPAVAELAMRLCAGFTDEEKELFRDFLLRFLATARENYIDKATMQPVQEATR